MVEPFVAPQQPPQSPIAVWAFPALWGMPSPSPFCSKLLVWLRMVGLDYELKPVRGPIRSSSGKVPFIERADGSTLCDSSVIQRTLTAEHGITLDDGMSDDDVATATLVQRTLEESLYFALLHERWVDDANWPEVRDGYFGDMPGLLRAVVPGLVIRPGVIKAARGQGVGRLPAGERDRRAATDLAAIARVLGEREHLLGAPRSIDATVFAFTWMILRTPFASPIGDALREHANLVSYAERMAKRVCPEANGD